MSFVRVRMRWAWDSNRKGLSVVWDWDMKVDMEVRVD